MRKLSDEQWRALGDQVMFEQNCGDEHVFYGDS